MIENMPMCKMSNSIHYAHGLIYLGGNMTDKYTVTTGDIEKKPSRFLKKYGWLLIAGAALIAAGIAAMALYDPAVSTNEPDKSVATEAEKILGREQTVAEKADYLNQQGKYAEAQKLLADSGKSAANPKERSRILESQALLALNAKKYDEAMKYAKESESINPTVSSASMVALIAENSGDKATAITYYELVLARLDDKTKQLDDTTVPYYEKKISELKK